MSSERSQVLPKLTPRSNRVLFYVLRLAVGPGGPHPQRRRAKGHVVDRRHQCRPSRPSDPRRLQLVTVGVNTDSDDAVRDRLWVGKEDDVLLAFGGVSAGSLGAGRKDRIRGWGLERRQAGVREGRHSQTKFFLRMVDLPLKDGPHAGGDGDGAPSLDLKGMRECYDEVRRLSREDKTWIQDH